MEKKISIMFMLVVAIIMTLLVPLIQYPDIYDCNDLFYHSSETEKVTNLGYVPTWETTYLQYPGSFLLVSITGIITGYDSAMVNTFILHPIIIIFLIIILYIFGLNFTKIAYLVPAFVFVYDLIFLNNAFMFNPQTYGVFLVILAVHSFYKSRSHEKNSMIYSIIFLLSSIVVVISHPLSTIALIFIYTGILLAEIVRDKKISNLRNLTPMIFILVLAVAWISFLASFTFNGFVTSIAKIASFKTLYLSVNKSIGDQTVNFIYAYYNKIVYLSIFLLASYSIIKFRKDKDINLLMGCVLGLGLIILFTAASFSLEWFTRGLLFLLIFLSILAVITLERTLSQKKHFHLLVIIIIIISMPISFSETYSDIYYDNTQTYQLSAVSFAAKYPNANYVASNIQNINLLAYYRPDIRINYYSVIEKGIKSKLLNRLNNSYVAIFSKKEFKWWGIEESSWESINTQLNENKIKVYDNGYYVEYQRPSI